MTRLVVAGRSGAEAQPLAPRGQDDLHVHATAGLAGRRRFAHRRAGESRGVLGALDVVRAGAVAVGGGRVGQVGVRAPGIGRGLPPAGAAHAPRRRADHVGEPSRGEPLHWS